MHPARRQRLLAVLFITGFASLAAGLVAYALRDNLNLYYPPSDIAAGKAAVGQSIRLGGVVVAGSVRRASDSLAVRFEVTDFAASVAVEYRGILPDLFAEGEGVVATGRLSESGEFVASEVLAKHDETYMPPEVAATLADGAGRP